MNFLAAVQFLTIIPIPRRREVTPDVVGRSTSYFPLVGLIIGIILAILNWFLSHVLPPNVVRSLLIVTLVVITGALHLDGLADTCDGLAGHKPVEDRLRVMRDSHTGAFGVIGLVLVLLIKYITLNSLPDTFMMAILIFMPVVSRWAMVFAIFTCPYARPSGLGTAFKEETRWPQFLAATLTTITVAAALFPFFSIMGFLLLFGIWVITVLLSIYLKGKFAGLTGDTYGAVNEVMEAMALLLTSLAITVAGNLR